MKRFPFFTLSVFLLTFSLVLFSGCKSSSSDTSVGTGESNTSEGGSSETSGGTGNFNTECGTVINGGTQNPAPASEGVAITIVRAAAANAVVISRANGEQLVRLRALSSSLSNAIRSRAIDIINSFAGSGVLFTDECTASVTGGGQGVVGDVFDSAGRSLTETLITQIAAEVSSTGTCDTRLVSGCYQSLREESGPETGATVSNFLWKPQSERDGRLVVLLNPGGATVVVNGTTLTNTGASNGRGTTARGDRSGGGYGTNITLQAFDSRGRVLVFPGGATSFTIANGADRVEF